MAAAGVPVPGACGISGMGRRGLWMSRAVPFPWDTCPGKELALGRERSSLHPGGDTALGAVTQSWNGLEQKDLKGP